MNREIKFRAWDKVQDAMVNFDIYNVPPYVGQTHLEGEKFERKYEIMQYTGLKDKNGTEIYEGDIVSYKGYMGNKNYCVIQARSGEWRIDNSRGGSVLIYVLEDVEVIGNIYENPELLERDE
ncbi:YopX family protein [Jeotgalicoccus huakuii]|nr:YopX family protein [Jeotgalicoccus huakuii]